MPKEDTPRPDTGATLREYTLTVEATMTVTVVVMSKSPANAAKWFRNVAVPNELVEHGTLAYDWTTIKGTVADDEHEAPCDCPWSAADRDGPVTQDHHEDCAEGSP